MHTAGSPSLPATCRDRDHETFDRPVDVDRPASCPVSVLRVPGRDGTSAGDPLSSWQPDRRGRDAGDGVALRRRYLDTVRMVER